MILAFGLGRVVITPGALAVLYHGEPAELIRRHQRGDWGDMDEDDADKNDVAVASGSTLLSRYRAKRDGQIVYVITEADRRITTILLPSEY